MKLQITKTSVFNRTEFIKHAKPDYVDDNYYWIDIQYPVSQKNLDNICKMSNNQLYNSMGELFLKKEEYV